MAAGIKLIIQTGESEMKEVEREKPEIPMLELFIHFCKLKYEEFEGWPTITVLKGQ